MHRRRTMRNIPFRRILDLDKNMMKMKRGSQNSALIQPTMSWIDPTARAIAFEPTTFSETCWKRSTARLLQVSRNRIDHPQRDKIYHVSCKPNFKMLNMIRKFETLKMRTLSGYVNAGDTASKASKQYGSPRSYRAVDGSHCFNLE